MQQNENEVQKKVNNLLLQHPKLGGPTFYEKLQQSREPNSTFQYELLQQSKQIDTTSYIFDATKFQIICNESIGEERSIGGGKGAWSRSMRRPSSE